MDGGNGRQAGRTAGQPRTRLGGRLRTERTGPGSRMEGARRKAQEHGKTQRQAGKAEG